METPTETPAPAPAPAPEPAPAPAPEKPPSKLENWVGYFVFASLTAAFVWFALQIALRHIVHMLPAAETQGTVIESGDRYEMGGSRTIARTRYFLALQFPEGGVLRWKSSEPTNAAFPVGTELRIETGVFPGGYEKVRKLTQITPAVEGGAAPATRTLPRPGWLGILGMITCLLVAAFLWSVLTTTKPGEKPLLPAWVLAVYILAVQPFVFMSWLPGWP